MKGQEQKLKKIIDESTCEDGTLDLKRMLLKITEHQAQRGGAPTFLCGPDKDFVPEVHYNELEIILENLKKKKTLNTFTIKIVFYFLEFIKEK